MPESAAAERIWFYPVDAVRNVAKFEAMDSKFSLDIPLHPFLGCIGSPLPVGGSQFHCAAENGGNMDAPEASAGTPLSARKRPRRVAVYGDGTRLWVTAKWPVQGSKSPCACVCRST